MPYTYQYTGSLPTVFISLEKDGATWVPSSGDTIELAGAIVHPLLTEVAAAQQTASADKAPAKNQPVTENQESPVAADEPEEN